MIDLAEQFKVTDAASYDSVTSEFDYFTDLFTERFAGYLISLAQILPGEHVLDIGTGTGIVAFNAAKKLDGGGRIIGIDLSDQMLAVAKAKALRLKLSDRLQFARMDAEALNFKDASFDSVLSLFALLHFPAPAVALKEMFRVLRPGGKLVLAVGSGPPPLSIAAVLQAIARLRGKVLELQKKRLVAPAYLNRLITRHIPANAEAEESTLAKMRHSRASAVREMISAAGFRNVRSYWQGNQAILQTPGEFWDLQRTVSSFARKRLAGASSESIQVVKTQFFSESEEVQSRGGSLVYPLAAFYVTAQRP